MSGKNLHQKIGILLDDIKTMDRSDQVRVITSFIKNELSLQESTYQWTEKDLTTIRSRAIALLVDLNPQVEIEGHRLYNNENLPRTYAMVQATYELMRGKELCPYTIGLQHKANKVQVCAHASAKPESGGSYKCPDCGEKVKPLLWVPEKFKES